MPFGLDLRGKKLQFEFDYEDTKYHFKDRCHFGHCRAVEEMVKSDIVEDKLANIIHQGDKM